MALMTTTSTRTFGIEIEMVGTATHGAIVAALTSAGIPVSNGRREPGQWVIKGDGSVSRRTRNGGYQSGIEVVSPVLTGNDGLAQVRKVVELLKQVGGDVNATCGLHVHHGASDLSPDAWKCLLKRYAKAEAVLTPLLAPSRRANRYCHHVSTFNGTSRADLWQRITAARDINGLYRIFGTRFMTVNLEAFGEHGTAEFRHHGGSLNPAKVVGWIVLTQALMEQAKRTNHAILTTEDFAFDLFVSGLSRRGRLCPVAARYWKKRYQDAINPPAPVAATPAPEFDTATLPQLPQMPMPHLPLPGAVVVPPARRGLGGGARA